MWTIFIPGLELKASVVRESYCLYGWADDCGDIVDDVNEKNSVKEWTMKDTLSVAVAVLRIDL